MTSKPPTTASNRDRKLLKATHRALRDISHEALTINQACSRSSANRIHSAVPPVRHYPTDASSFRTVYSRPSAKENVAPASQAAPTKPNTPQSLRPAVPPRNAMLRMPQSIQTASLPSISRLQKANKNTGPLEIVFSGSLIAEPPRSSVASTMHPRSVSPHRAQRSHGSSFRYESVAGGSAGYPKTNMTRSDDLSTRNPQGHRAPPCSFGKSTLAPRIQSDLVDIQTLEAYRQDTNATLSNLSSRVGFLESTVAAALPIVAEARLLWMEHTVVKARTKLSTTRQALCQYCK